MRHHGFKLYPLNQHIENVGLLYDLNKLEKCSKDGILKNCQDLHAILKVGESSHL